MNEMVAVTWTDAFFQLEDDGERPDEYTVTTLGYVVDRSAAFLRVAGEKTPDGWRAVTHIPRALVSDIIDLGQIP